MTTPALPDSVSVQAGIDVQAMSDDFAVFEAMHHSMDLCNPMSSSDLDSVLAALELTAESSMIDLGCGHGEALLRSAQRFGIVGHGVDLSPWVLDRAAARAEAMDVADQLSWTLGDAGAVEPEGRHDAALCLGVSWVWNGFAGTIDALTAHVGSGGRIVCGDIQRRSGLEPLSGEFSTALSRAEQLAILDSRGLSVIAEVEPADASWDDYDQRIADATEAWRQSTPGEVAERAIEMQAWWKAEHLAARRANVTWTVWIAEKA